jgi:ABC-type nitrate/sulfonate/bicarbonate transport system, ATPase component
MVRLRLEAATRSFAVEGHEIRALDGVDLELREGETLAIVGPSGSGKTTLLRAAAGLEALDSGRASLSPGTRIGFVFQEPRLLSSLTVEGNVALGLEGRVMRSHRGARIGGAGARRHEAAEQRERVASMLRLLGLATFRDAYPRQLSGGLAQRVSLARALVREPELLFLDEPFSALDAPLRMRLQDELLETLGSRTMSALFVTHDIGEAIYLGDRVIALSSGRIARDERIALARPRDRRSRYFLELADSFAQTLGAAAPRPAMRAPATLIES